MKKLFLLLTALAVTVMAHAQTITLGDNTTISNQVPIHTLYNYSLTEHLFLADEIEFAGNIRALRFRIAYTYSTEHTFHIDIYMKHVSRNSFSDPVDAEAFSPNDKVYSGPWTIPADTDGWLNIDFDTPFAYNGTDNLLIGMDNNSGDFAIRYFMFSEAAGTVLSYYSDEQNPDPCDPTSFTSFKEVTSQRPNVKLVFGGNVNVAEDCEAVLKAHPNPTNDILYLEGVENEMVRVYDVTGRLVMQTDYHGGLNMDGLKSGVYAIITSKGLVKVMKE